MVGWMAAALLLAGQEAAAPPAEGDPTVLAPVDVTGRARGLNLETRIDDFVGQVAAPIGDDWGPARWNRRIPLCVGAVNFRPEAARQLIDRVATAAAEVDLRIANPGCGPAHVMIVATNDGAGTARALVERSQRLFVGGGDGMDLGRAALERFQSGDRAVRCGTSASPSMPTPAIPPRGVPATTPSIRAIPKSRTPSLTISV